ncbi:uncharacterized protein KY384_005278 [Bacidia gigantensis]|uniref:uncharacterized protein n=1 Tax=Bacidia gigantensis TaxID=2732470 RepID=UPI001D037493|nr:uncharacterized protein KY384_005278 [Bacidia gigantensis]KAG8529797.1 hypothetical protein KY384_005278 [Bacidia gigantensis]
MSNRKSNEAEAVYWTRQPPWGSNPPGEDGQIAWERNKRVYTASELIVVGDQSSGKSSVLEGLTELPFPRDSTLCTRFATQIIFRRAEQESVTVSIIPSPSTDAAREAKLKAFTDDSMKVFSADDFKRLLAKLWASLLLSEILDMAAEVDPSGQRTLGILTKPDLVDKEAEQDIIDLVRGRKKKLKLGYCVVRNRGKQERNLTSAERNRGPTKQTSEQQRRYLLGIATKFQEITTFAVEAQYGRHQFLKENKTGAGDTHHRFQRGVL